MDRFIVYDYVKEKYGTEPEYLWNKFPNYAVLRHPKNNKWYAAFMDIPKDKLGLDGKEIVDILDVKCNPILIGSLLKKDGFFPAYHMNRENWITILLDGTVSKDEIFMLLDLSYEMIGKNK